MKSNSHLSLEERSKISVLQSSGESVRSIARILGRSPSTISRELNRTQADKFLKPGRAKSLSLFHFILQKIVKQGQVLTRQKLKNKRCATVRTF